MSFKALEIVGKSGFVHSVEPGPLTYGRLQSTKERNYLENLKTYQLGLSDKNGELQWKLDRTNLGNACLVENGGDVVVHVQTLDDFIMTAQIKQIDFVKIDVGGMELSIFKGATDTLRKIKPTVVFETLSERRINQISEGSRYSADIENLLIANGYVLFAFTDSGYRRTSIHDSSDDTIAVHSKNIRHLEILSLSIPSTASS